MVKQRETYKIIMPKEYEERILNNQCPVCGLPKEEWKRRKDWTNCSWQCTETYKKYVIYGWDQLREKVFERDNYTCAICRRQFNKNYTMIGDHIIPIACGGDQWDINNIQTLCEVCNKEKTRNDHKDIAYIRRKEKLKEIGQQTFR